MSHQKSLSLVQPIIAQAASSFIRVGEINPTLSPTYSNYAIRGDVTRRGACHFYNSTPLPILLRGVPYGNSPKIIPGNDLTSFYGEITPGPGTAFANISNIRFFGVNLWVVGQDTLGQGKVLYLTMFLNIATSGSYSNKSSEVPAGANPIHIRQAQQTGNLYIAGRLGSGNLMILRGTDSTPFSNICVTAINPGSDPVSYHVSDDGLNQLVCASGGVYRSTNGGVNWSSFATSLANPINEVAWSQKYSRWLIASGSGTAIHYYNGSSWVPSTFAGTNISFTAKSTITHIEQLDTEGRCYLAVCGFTPATPQIYTYLSMDGGQNWVTSQVLIPPNYDTNTIPVGSSVALVNSGSRVLLYHGNIAGEWNFDNSAWSSPITSFSIP